jgi:glycine cleavage system H lipoate-binding protein
MEVEMVALFIVALVAVLLIADLVLAAGGHASLAQTLRQRQENKAVAAARVGGFVLAPDRAYHPGHTWARYEGGSLARVGVDEFASKLIGTPDRVELPAVGTPVRAGRPMAHVSHEGRRTAIVAPISGVVVATNRSLVERPQDLAAAPYDDGWLLEVRGEQLRLDLRALLSGDLARRWMDESVSVLHRMFSPGEAVPAVADGGEPVDGISDLLDDAEWDRARARFLLSDPE